MLRLSTCSNRSFSDETVKNFSRVSCRFGQSTNICLTVSGRLVCKICSFELAPANVYVVMRSVVSVCVCVFVCPVRVLSFEIFDLRKPNFGASVHLRNLNVKIVRHPVNGSFLL